MTHEMTEERLAHVFELLCCEHGRTCNEDYLLLFREEFDRLQPGPLIDYINMLLEERNAARTENAVLRQAFAILTTELPEATQ